MASGSDDKTIIIWDKKTWTPARILQCHERHVEAITWSPNGKYLASGGNDRKIIIWDKKTWKPTRVFSDLGHASDTMAWSPDGKYLASGSHKEIVVISLEETDLEYILII